MRNVNINFKERNTLWLKPTSVFCITQDLSPGLLKGAISGFSQRTLKIFCCCLLFIVQNSFAQKIVTGKVTDEKGKPLPGAVVVAKGAEGIASDTNGIFKITVQPSAEILAI